MNRHIYLLKLTAASAAATARVCYRQSVKDCWKICNVLTSDEAIALYRFVIRAVLVAMALTIMAGQWLRRYCDRTVESSIDKDIAGAAGDDRATGADIANASDTNPVSIGRIARRRYLNDAVNVAKHVIAQPRHCQPICVDRWRALLNLSAMVNRVRYSRNLGH